MGTTTIYGAGLQSLPRTILTQQTVEYPIPAWHWRRFGDAAGLALLPAAPDGTNIGLKAGTPILIGSTTATTVTEYAVTSLKLPPEYDAGETVTVRLHAKVSAAASTSAKVDIEFYLSDREGGNTGGDLCADGEQTLSTSYVDKDFTITPGGLSPGDLIEIKVKFELIDNSDGALIQATGSLLLDVKG